MPKHKLTKLYVARLAAPAAGQILIWDTELPGFGLRVGTKTKAFIAEAKVNRSTRRVTLGTYPRMTPAVARKDARKALQDMERGIDPRPAETLEAAFKAFKEVRTLAPRTLYDYERYYKVYFKPWHNRPVNEISPGMVSKRHLEIAQKHGGAQANGAMRFLRSLLSLAKEQYQLSIENPVSTLGRKRQWFREAPRQNVIKAHELAAWFGAVLALRNDDSSQDRETFRDYFLLLLLLGLRRTEAAKLRAEHVDLKARTVTFLETKNKEPKTLPVGPYVEEIMRRRLEARPEQSPWVFWSALDPKRHLVEPRKALAEVVRTSAVKHTLHDLRRSFATFLEGLDVSVYAARRLMGHKARSDDVLGRHYVVADVERVRPAIEKLESFILSAAGVKPSAAVSKLDERRGTRGGA